MSCGKRTGPPVRLSEWGLRPEKMVRYELRTPLFSDYADKDRAVLLPAGQKAKFDAEGVYEFPVGTVIAKTFSFAGRKIETRLLVREASGWVGLPYVWDAAQTEARLELVPDPVPMEHTAPSGEKVKFEYTIPNANQCKNCHENSGVMAPIGPKARHLSREHTLALTGATHEPAPLDSTEQRARMYLDINCAHCHNPQGPANTTGLVLTYNETDPAKLGVCKVPVAAGPGAGRSRFGVNPGQPDDSILLYRMRSTESKIMMPEVGRAVVHREGVELVRAWIAEMRGGCQVARR
jgi:hypothetical protein